MYLKTLTIKGFKSFARPTTFEFEPGVTAVVGPNGSGKSNVVDALAWVMGEQGVKTLRGGRMEDVIFAGTTTRSPLGRAEVTLTIDNTDGALPIDYAEVTISRTLFRSGASEYAINGESCRLLDIQELLSDTGMGREMHVIVGQGRLDAVLRATPEDRRGFVEEAAGILKHRRRKERTQRKLEAMEANFTRLNDLAGELRRQLKPLGAQAEVARRAQDIQASAREAKGRLLAGELVRTGRELRAAEELVGGLRNDRSQAQEEWDDLQRRQRALDAQAPSEELDRARRVTFDLEKAEQRFRSLHALAVQRITLLGESESVVEVDPDATARRAARAEAEAESLSAVVEAASADYDGAVTARQAAQAEVDAVDRAIAEQNALLSRHDLRRAELQSAEAMAASRRDSAVQAAERQAKAAEQARGRVARAEEEARAALAEERDEDVPDVDPEASAALAAALSRRDAAREAHAAVLRERDTWAARYSALSSALDMTGSAVVAAEVDSPDALGAVGDAMTVRRGYERAVAAALGGLVDAVLVRDSAAAWAIYRELRSDGGAVEVVVADTPWPVSARWALPANAVWMPDVVDAPDGVRSLLAGTVVVADLAAGVAVLDEAKDDWTVVTQEGDVLTRALLRSSGQGDSRIELNAERDHAAHERDRVAERCEAAEKDLADAERQVVEARRLEQDSRTQMRALRRAAQESRSRASRARAALDAARAELTRLEPAVSDAEEAHRVAQRRWEDASRALAAFEEEPMPLVPDTDRSGVVKALEAAREAELDARLRLETARERQRVERQRGEGLRRQEERERRALEQAAHAAAVRHVQRERAQRIAEMLPDVLQHISGAIAEAKREEARLEAERTARNEELARLREEVAEHQRRVQSLTERIHGVELSIHEHTMARTTALERTASELGLDEAGVLAEYTVEDLDEDAERRRLAEAERRLARLGRINPLALEEYAALEQRHSFLTAQLADLKRARTDLEQIIASIDDTMQGVFLEAFDDTRTAFHEVFPVLFPGGTGDISLTDPDHPLTTGIDVAIRPAGKRIDRLSLLSGGERSLAAIALLVAIFTARPSPFYVMDEVEAALDDANLGRLLAVLERLRSDSQLIIITHQKRTMEIADALYGVSMRQDGVSTVVGQRLPRDDTAGID